MLKSLFLPIALLLLQAPAFAQQKPAPAQPPSANVRQEDSIQAIRQRELEAILSDLPRIDSAMRAERMADSLKAVRSKPASGKRNKPSKALSK